MMLDRSAPAGARRPGHHRRWRGDGGAVTVEAALALLAMTVVLAGVVWALGLLVAQLALGDAARAAARVAARADSAGEAEAEAIRLVPGAAVSLRSEGDHVVVEIRRVVRGPGLLARFGEIELLASATAAAEPA